MISFKENTNIKKNIKKTLCLRMSKRLLPKPFWKHAKGAAERSKRLKLTTDENNLFICPVDNCDSEPYKSQRGSRIQ